MLYSKKVLLHIKLVTLLLYLPSARADQSSCSSSTDCNACTQSQNLLQPHSFAISMARDIMLEKPAWNTECDTEGWYSTFGLGFDYFKSLDANQDCAFRSCCSSMGSVPFWATDQSNAMTIGDNSGLYDLDAYQMGLGPVTTSGVMQLAPTNYQIGGDLFFYTGSHKTTRGWFIKVQGPIGMTCTETCIKQTGDLVPENYPSGALESGEVVTPVYDTMANAFQGGVSAGDLLPLEIGRIVFKKTSQAKLGDLVASVGYNFYADAHSHAGIALHATAPTGNIANATTVLQPIFGRNGHWGLGAELIGHCTLWHNKEDDLKVELWFDGIADHLFKVKQLRSFDLKENGLGSKYLLVANYANNTYQNEITNAVNITTIPILSSFDVEADFAIMCNVQGNSWSAGIGYEGWFRSCETLNLPCACPSPINLNNYAILGRQDIVNNLCQPTATISKSEDVQTSATSLVLDATDPANRIPQSYTQALHIDGQKAHTAYTSKIFTQIAYNFDYKDCNPYLAIAGGAELSNKKNSAISYWLVGVQGGTTF